MSGPAPNLWLRLFLPFSAGYFFSYFLRNANAVIAPDLTRELGLSAADLGVLTGAYLAAFGLFQLPLGLLLDRFGPRRVEASLLLFAAAGCLLFAHGTSLGMLVGARALIGLGVSACLMASFATFARWFGQERQASLNGAVMAAGAAGALAASAPMAALAGELGWRATFTIMAGVELLVALLIYFTPEKPGVLATSASLSRQLAAIGDIFRSRAFWIFAPQATLVVGGFMALQSLWAVPFLMQAEGFSRALAAERMLISAVGMLVGFIAVAVGALPLTRRGVSLEWVLGGSYVFGLVALALITLGIDPAGSMWCLLGACYGISNLGYALLQKRFDLALAGRVNTALNLMSFVGAFVVQWLFGLGVDALRVYGLNPEMTYRAAMALLLSLQVLGALWYWRGIQPSRR